MNGLEKQYRGGYEKNLDCDPSTGCCSIRTEGLSLCYGDQLVFSEVNLKISSGEITAIVGPSGCGKSSLLYALIRMMDYVPNANVSGNVIIDNKKIYTKEYNIAALRKRIGMIFQSPAPFPLTIRKNFDLPLIEHGVKNKTDREAIMVEALNDAGLWNEVKDNLDKSALSLSGGQQQRLCIARALCLKPDALILDEPCSALDPISTSKMEALFLELKGKYTIALVTHNLAQAKRVSDKIAFFWCKDNVGRLIEYGNTQDIFSNPKDELTRSYIHGLHG